MKGSRCGSQLLGVARLGIVFGAVTHEGESAPFSWSPDLVQVLETGGLAISSGPVVAASGESSGRFNSIWRKEADGQWRVVFDKGS